MADDMPAPRLQFVESESAGYCDPVTGVCVVPAPAPPAPASEARPQADPGPEPTNE